VVDPGHGGKDFGEEARSAFWKKNVVMPKQEILKAFKKKREPRLH
jgi:N-acetylmuramoyl-L-alanine amidase